jgi:hypothetical protein
MNPTYQVIRGGRVSNDQCWLNLAVQRIDSYAGFGLKAAVHISDPRVRFGSKAAIQGTPASVCCQLKSGSSASECPELEVKPT